MLSALIRYFDLQSGRRVLKPDLIQSAGLMLGGDLKNFELSSPMPPGLTVGLDTAPMGGEIFAGNSTLPGGAGATTHSPVIPQYLAVAAGVIIEPFLRHYIETSTWNFDFKTFWGRVVFGLIVSIIILPGIYKSSFDPKQPVLIQIAALMPLGIGWQSIFMSATQAVTG